MSSIYHHGINGQKWGVRNGPPYPLGTSDHSSSEKKAGWKKSLKSAANQNKPSSSRNDASEKSKKATITREELSEYRHEMMDRYAKNAGKQKYYRESTDEQLQKDIERQQTMKKVAIGVAVTAGIGVGVYFAYKHDAIGLIKERLGIEGKADLDIAKKAMRTALDDTDIVLDKGSVINRMSAYSDIDFSKVNTPTFASYKEKDVLTYMTKLGDFNNTGKRYDVALEAIKDIRMPSEDKARKVFEELWKTDKSYRKDLEQSLLDMYTDILKRRIGEDELSQDFKNLAASKVRTILRDDPFNGAIEAIARQGNDSKTLISRFVDLGYSAIEDYHDKGSFADSPIILLNPSSSVVKRGEDLVTESMKRIAEVKLIDLI